MATTATRASSALHPVAPNSAARQRAAKAIAFAAVIAFSVTLGAVAGISPRRAALVGGAACALILLALAVRFPFAALWLMLVTTVLFEDPITNGIVDGGGGWQALFYARLPGQLSVTDLMLFGVLLGGALRRRVSGHDVPRSLMACSAALGVALLLGMATGVVNGASLVGLLNQSRHVFYLAALPLATWAVLPERRQQDLLLLTLAALAGVKALEGTVLGLASAATHGAGVTPVFYNPATNWVLVLALTAVVMAWLTRTRVRWWIWLSAVLGVVALALSLRRGFWIALAVAVVLVLASRPYEWKRVAVAAGIIATLLVAMWIAPFPALQAAKDRVATLTPAG